MVMKGMAKVWRGRATLVQPYDDQLAEVGRWEGDSVSAAAGCDNGVDLSCPRQHFDTGCYCCMSKDYYCGLNCDVASTLHKRGQAHDGNIVHADVACLHASCHMLSDGEQSDGEQSQDMLCGRKVAGPYQHWASCCWAQQEVMAPQECPRRSTAYGMVVTL